LTHPVQQYHLLYLHLQTPELYQKLRNNLALIRKLVNAVYKISFCKFAYVFIAIMVIFEHLYFTGLHSSKAVQFFQTEST